MSPFPDPSIPPEWTFPIIVLALLFTAGIILGFLAIRGIQKAIK